MSGYQFQSDDIDFPKYHFRLIPNNSIQINFTSYRNI